MHKEPDRFSQGVQASLVVDVGQRAVASSPQATPVPYQNAYNRDSGGPIFVPAENGLVVGGVTSQRRLFCPANSESIYASAAQQTSLLSITEVTRGWLGEPSAVVPGRCPVTDCCYGITRETSYRHHRHHYHHDQYKQFAGSFFDRPTDGVLWALLCLRAVSTGGGLAAVICSHEIEQREPAE